MSKSTINAIYKQYQIMPNLQTHQLRVAAVAQTIGDHMGQTKVNTDEVIAACLLHDMGNIIKFNLEVFPQFCQPKGVEYWQKVKDEYIEKYGSDEHHATIQIAQELAVSPKVLAYIEAIGFSKSKDNVATTDYGQKICAYSDMRVGPYGIISLEKRFEDLRKRYQKKYAGSEHEERRTLFETCLRTIQSQLQQEISIELDQITDQTINDKIEDLKNWSFSS